MTQGEYVIRQAYYDIYAFAEASQANHAFWMKVSSSDVYVEISRMSNGGSRNAMALQTIKDDQQPTFLVHN